MRPNRPTAALPPLLAERPSSPARRRSSPPSPAPACGGDADRPDPAAYRKEIEAWRQERVASLKKEDGWLTLVGLYWLKPGENRFGSDPGDPVILPQGKAPALAGTLTLEGDARSA